MPGPKRKKEGNSSRWCRGYGGADEPPPTTMASSALRRSLPRRAVLRRALPPHPPPAVAGAACAFRRSFQSGDGENADEFEERLFGRSEEGSLYAKLDRVGNAGRRIGIGSRMGGFGDRSSSGSMGGFDSLNDGLSEMLGDAARNLQVEDEEDDSEDFWESGFEFRPDMEVRRGSTYTPRDLDLTRPAAAKNPPRQQFETTTKEVLRKADFRNVRFLSNFLTEAGIIIKRSQTRISAKAQRKVAREIKTARAFGLMPFTTMGRKPFVFGRSAQEHYSEEENEYGYGYRFVRQKDAEPDEGNANAEPDVEVA